MLEGEVSIYRKLSEPGMNRATNLPCLSRMAGQSG